MRNVHEGREDFLMKVREERFMRCSAAAAAAD
jgi:hypothetical protein